MKAIFRPSARILDLIGKELIIDDYAAIIELVKNSYDADAELCKVIFEWNEKTLVIRVKDDGHWMSEKEIFENRLIPWSDNKKKWNWKSRKKWRVFLGNKWLWRFSVWILWDEVDLSTTQNWFTSALKFNLADFRKAKYLDQVNIDIETTKTWYKDGTTISIKSNWGQEWFRNKDSLDKLIREMNLMLPKKDQRPDFKLMIVTKNIDWLTDSEIEIEWYDIMDHYFYRINWEIDENWVWQFIYENTQTWKKETINDYKTRSVGGVSCWKIKVDLRVFDRDPVQLIRMYDLMSDQLTWKILERSDINKSMKLLLDSQVGVHIKRGFFSIRPYWEIDRLELDKKRVQRPSLKIWYNQLLWTLDIESEELSGLLDKSARDWLQDNTKFDSFKDSIYSTLNLLAIRRFHYREEIWIARSHYQNKNPLTEQTKTLENLEKVVEKSLDSKSLKSEEWSKKVIKDIEKQVKKVKQASSNREKYFKEVIWFYQSEATLWKVMTIVIHEIRVSIWFIRDSINLLKWIADKIIKEFNKVNLSNFKSIIDSMWHQIERIILFVEKLEPLGKRKGKKKKINLLNFLESTLKIFDKPIKDNWIEIVLDVGKDLEINFLEQDLISIIINLIDNSIFWLTLDKIKEPKIYLKSGNNWSPFLSIWDNWRWLEISDIESKVIFEPWYSNKPWWWSWIWLTIVGESTERNDGELSVKNNDFWGAEFTIKFLK